MSDIFQRLTDRIQAGTALIYLQTFESARTIDGLKEVAKNLNRDFAVWTPGVGLKLTEKSKWRSEDPVAVLQNSTEGATAVLDAILARSTKKNSSDKDPAPSIYVLRMFHGFMENVVIQTKLMDAGEEMRKNFQTLLIVSPIVKIPKELDKEFISLEVPLPTREELALRLETDRRMNEEIMRDKHYRTKGGVQLDPNAFALSPELIETIVESAAGLTEQEAAETFALSYVKSTRQGAPKLWDPGLIMTEKCKMLQKDGLLELFPPSASFNDVGGLDGLKSWLAPRKEAFTKEAKEYGLEAPKGVLLVGPPGVGKSLVAKAIAGFFEMPLLRLDFGRIYGSLVGESEANMRKVFQTVEAMHRCVLWADEIEKGLGGSSGGGGDSGTSKRVLGTFLTWMSERKTDVFCVATANDVTKLPPELLRKGRFDEFFSVRLPTQGEREEIFRIHLAKRGRGHLVDQLRLPDLAGATNGFSGSEIEEAVKEAMGRSFHDGRRELNATDLQKAIEATKPLSTTMSEQIEAINKWCETRTRPAGAVEEQPLKVARTRRGTAAQA
jgi:SpoVK/Ycf46/Vps4 family AAA+-type ATPase